MTEDTTYINTIYVRKTAFCPNCGTESPCYYSVLDEDLTIICNKCKMRTKVRQVEV